MLKAAVAGLAGTMAGARIARADDDSEQPGGIRYSCFYQVGRNVIDVLAQPDTGLPNDPWHVHVFAHSHATAYADRTLADYIHAYGESFKYAPAFDLHEFPGWKFASEDQLAEWGRGFRDDVLTRGADCFSFNELPTNTPTDTQARDAIMTLLQYLGEPDENGNRLPGVLFMTHAPSMPGNWDSPASEFWQRVDETCSLVVAEHYHGNGFICQNSETYLSNHYFAMRDWLFQSSEPAKVSIANDKFTILHSSRYGPGSSGWQGADSNIVPFDMFQRDLARCASLTRGRAGGFNRISFAPLASVYTDERVIPYLADLINWHYNQGGAASETDCLNGDPDGCQCGA